MLPDGGDGGQAQAPDAGADQAPPQVPAEEEF